MLTQLKIAYRTTGAKVQTLAVLTLILIGAYITYQLNIVYGELYSGIQIYNKAMIWSSIRVFTYYAMGMVLVNAFVGTLGNRLSFTLRTALTKHYCELDIASKYPQQIQEDLKRFSDSIVELGVAVTRATIKLPLFLGVVITLTGWKQGLAILVAIVAGTLLTRYIGSKLVSTQSQMESAEAEFRISIARGDRMTFYFPISELFTEYNSKLKRLLLTQNTLSQIFVLLPFMVLMPLYIAKVITMGAFFQAVNALSKIIDSLSVLVDNRQVLVNIETTTKRLSYITKTMLN